MLYRLLLVIEELKLRRAFPMTASTNNVVLIEIFI